MPSTRVGLIGTGYWARVIHGASVVQHPAAELVGVWGRDASKTAAAAQELGTQAYSDLDALLNDVDALTFAVPPDVQSPIAKRAAQRGRHLLLEKPVATSAESAREVEAAVSAANVGSIVFFTRRFRPAIQDWLGELDRQGGWHVGRIEVTANLDGGPFAESPWRRERGALWDVGPHALSMLVPVLGDVTWVTAGGGRGDLVHLVMRHGGERSSTASLSLTAPKATLGGSTYFEGEHGRVTAPTATSGNADIVAAHQQALDGLITQIEQPGSGHPCDVHFGTRVVEVLSAAEQSLATGRGFEVSKG
jgi:predicted dehydrogenase